MPQFFHGKQRKLGLVTLVLSLAMLSLWLRHSLNQDHIQYEFGRWQQTLASNQNGLWLVTSSRPGDIYQPGIHAGIHNTFALPGNRRPFSDDPFDHLKSWGWNLEQRWDRYGFRHARYYDDRPISGIRLEFLIIPHLALVLPLTLVSAWLLLSSQSPIKHPAEPPKQRVSDG